MITVLYGDNSFEIEHALSVLVSDFSGQAERLDGQDLVISDLPGLFMGATLFADKRLIIIKGLAENKDVWDVLLDWVDKLSDDIDLVLIEKSLDKRTKLYKHLQANANLREFKQWGDRDSLLAEKWTIAEAGRQGLVLDSKQARLVVERAGLDQWRIFHAIEKLVVLDEVDEKSIEEFIESSPQHNVFRLFELGLNARYEEMYAMLEDLSQTADPYAVFGLVSGQAFQLAALAFSDKPSGEVAKDIGAHPFVMSKLSPHAKRLGRDGVRKVVLAFEEADAAIKSGSPDVWMIIERALIKITS